MSEQVLPNFLVIGAPKAATTSLCFYLGQHPDVCMAKPKEPFFFSHNYEKGWAWYARCFPDAASKKAVGEGTTVYCQTGTFPEAVHRIGQHLPRAKIIYIVREPFERLESMWMEHLSQGKTTLPFNRAIREDPQYLDSALYWKNLNAFRQYFPDERIQVLFYEDYKADPHAVLRRCFSFLGVDPTVRIEGAEQPRYTSAEKRRDRWMTNLIRRTGVLETLRDCSPMWLQEFAKRRLKQPIEGRPEWEDKIRGYVAQYIKKDIETFNFFVGRSVWDQTIDFKPSGACTTSAQR